MPRERIAGGYLYYDATTDDARLVLDRRPHRGRPRRRRRQPLPGRRAHERAPTGRSTAPSSTPAAGEITVRARVVVNATGVWADEVRALDDGRDPDSIRPAKGVHLTVPWEQGAQRHRRRHPGAAATSAACSSCRGARKPDGTFEHTYIGTTDTDYDGPLDDPPCTARRHRLRARRAQRRRSPPTSPPTTSPGVWAGLRPLVKSADDAAAPPTCPAGTASTVEPGRASSSITGGKLTTYREMAEDTVDERAPALGREARCRTKRLRLLGADGYQRRRRRQPPTPTSATATARRPPRSRR